MTKKLVAFLNTLGITLFSILLIVILLGQTIVISGESMEPSLSDGENVFADKLSLNILPIKRDDIIVFRLTNSSDTMLIKRVVGLPSEKVTIEGKEIQVPSDAYYVMGDNKTHSTDSRTFGTINKNNILGRAIVVYKPLSSLRFIL